jgi:AcrR family transcriptional regulator
MKTTLELDTRSKLLEAAIKVFGEVGFECASVRQIADLAGVNHGSIKYHYSSKIHLWRSVVGYLFNQLEAAVFANSSNWASMTPREQVIDHMSTYVRFNARYPQLARMILLETVIRSERYEWLAENYLRPFADRAIARTALAQEEGLFRSDIAPLSFYHLNVAASRSLLLAATELNQHYGIDIFSESEIQRHIDDLVKLFVLPEQG